LLFLPTTKPNLRAVISYYSSTVTLDAAGDVHVTNDTFDGLGRHLFSKPLFGNIASIGPSPRASSLHKNPESPSIEPSKKYPPSDLASQPLVGGSGAEYPQEPEQHQLKISLDNNVLSKEEVLLTDMLPQSGYFLAGGIAGVVSRTATAPFDRLKVYLIAQTGVKNEAAKALKEGAPVEALTKTSRPLIEATKSLWRMGGIRSLFAGMYFWHEVARLC
jgi:solute carrier family 25 (mitochondrial phosphate transporter), member 23/24/25/41